MANTAFSLPKATVNRLVESVYNPSTEAAANPPGTNRSLPLSALQLAPWNARKFFDEAALLALATDMEKNGLLNPLLVRPLSQGNYEIISGARRYKAAEALDWQEIEVKIVSVADQEAYRLGLADNIERQDLNPYEQTLGYLFLLEQALFPQEPEKALVEIPKIFKQYWSEYNGNKDHGIMGSDTEALILNVFSGSITWQTFYQHRLPLLNLPNDVQDVLKAGKLAYSKARFLGRIADAALRQRLLEAAISEDLPLSALKKRLEEAQHTVTPPTAPRHPDLLKKWQALDKRLKKSPPPPAQSEKILALLVEVERLLQDSAMEESAD